MDPLAGDQVPDSQAAPQPAAIAPQPTDTPATGTIAPQAMPEYQQPAAPQQQRRPGLAGVMDTVLDFLSHRPDQVSYDDAGRHTTPAPPMTTGQKIGRIAGTALVGAARGLAAPPGPAHAAQGAAAGTLGAVDDAERQADKQDATAQQAYDAAQKAKMNDINYQLGIRAIAKNDLELKSMGVKANEDQINFSNGQIDREKALGSYDLGMAKDAAGIADVVSKMPDWEKQLYNHEGLQPHPVYDENGNRLGIQIYLRKPDVDSQPAPQGTKVEKFNPPTEPGAKPTVSTFTPVGPNGEPPTNGEIDKYKRAFLADSQAWQKNAADADEKAAQAAQARANASKAPSEIALQKAEAAKAYADANKSRRETALLGADGADPEVASMNHDQIVKGMLNGSVDITKAVGIFRDPHARESYIADAQRADPSWTMAKYNAMRKVREDAADGKIADQVQSFQTFTGHAAGLVASIQKLRNTNARILNTPINAIKKQGNAAALAEVIPEIEAVRNEFQNFLANHALQKNEIERGEAMLDENQTPAAMQAAVKSFETIALTKLGAVNYRYKSRVNGEDLPGLLDPNSTQAIKDFGLGDYAHRALYMNEPAAAAPGPPQPGGGAAQSLAGPIQPGEHVTTGPAGQIVLRGGKWVNPTTGQVVQ